MKIIKYDDIRFKKIYLFIFLSFIVFLLSSWFVSSAFNPATFCKDKTDGVHCCNSQSYVMECLCTNEELQSTSTCESERCINGRCVPIEENEEGTKVDEDGSLGTQSKPVTMAGVYTYTGEEGGSSSSENVETVDVQAGSNDASSEDSPGSFGSYKRVGEAGSKLIVQDDENVYLHQEGLPIRAILPCRICDENGCEHNELVKEGDSCYFEDDTADELQSEAEESIKKDNAPKTLTIDIARFVRNTVSFAELGSMAGTWLDKTLGTSFFSTPLWGELEKTWPLGAKFFGGNWESSICRDLWCIIPDDAGISTVGSAIGSHIEGQKLKISDELNLYKITFALNPATESLTGQMNFTIELYDQSGDKEYIDVNNDKKPDTWININNKYATSKTNPIAFYSEKDYQKICLKFFNTKDYIDELRLLLLSNSNQICTKFFEGDPSDAISEIQTGEIQVGGEVDECANC